MVPARNQFVLIAHNGLHVLTATTLFVTSVQINVSTATNGRVAVYVKHVETVARVYANAAVIGIISTLRNRSASRVSIAADAGSPRAVRANVKIVLRPFALIAMGELMRYATYAAIGFMQMTYFKKNTTTTAVCVVAAL